MAAFAENEQVIREVNSRGLSYWLGHNEFSDLTHDEFLNRFLNGTIRHTPQKAYSQVHEVSSNTSPETLDWVAKGAVTSVKNQGKCGGCWAFSAVGAVEGAYVVVGQNPLTQFSEQQLISCDTTQSGCDGGVMEAAFSWISTNGGLCSEGDFPYTSGSGALPVCTDTCNSAVTVGGHTSVKTETAMVDALVQ